MTSDDLTKSRVLRNSCVVFMHKLYTFVFRVIASICIIVERLLPAVVLRHLPRIPCPRKLARKFQSARFDVIDYWFGPRP
jgi:hypothetical protein